MDNLVVFTWVAYFLCALALLVATWKLLRPLPLGLQASLLLSQLALLLIPAPVVAETWVLAEAWAPAFAVVLLDSLTEVPVIQRVEKTLPLVVALVAAWPLGFAFSWLVHRRQAKSRTEDQAEG